MATVSKKKNMLGGNQKQVTTKNGAGRKKNTQGEIEFETIMPNDEKVITEIVKTTKYSALLHHLLKFTFSLDISFFVFFLLYQSQSR
jgi:hypothetical protein